MENNYIGCVVEQTSAAHTFGNVTAQVQKWLLDQFPAETFKTIHVHTKLAHRQIMSTPKEFLKKAKPMLIMKPRVEWDDNDTFLKGTLLTEAWYDAYHTWGDGNLQGFISDPRRNLYLKWLLNRAVLTFDISFVWSTYMEQIDWTNYMRNKEWFHRPFFITTQLESYLSKDLMSVLSKCSGMSIHDKNGSVKPFLDYLNSHSCYPVTYKLKGSSGNEEFFRYYPANIDARVTNLAADDGDRAGMVAGSYTTNMTLRVEFYHTGLYYLYSPMAEPRMLQSPKSATIIPVYTDIIEHDDYRLDNGWREIARSSFQLENPISDSIEIDSILNLSVKTVIKYHLETGLPLENFIDIKIRKQGDLIKRGDDYKVDYESLQVKLFHGNTYQTYTIIVYANLKYMNEMIKEVCDLD